MLNAVLLVLLGCLSLQAAAQGTLLANWAPATLAYPGNWNGVALYAAGNVSWTISAPMQTVQINISQFSIACGDSLTITESVRGPLATLTCSSSPSGQVWASASASATLQLSFTTAPASPGATGFVISYRAVPLTVAVAGTINMNLTANETGAFGTPFPFRVLNKADNSPYPAFAGTGTSSWVLRAPPGYIIWMSPVFSEACETFSRAYYFDSATTANGLTSWQIYYDFTSPQFTTQQYLRADFQSVFPAPLTLGFGTVYTVISVNATSQPCLGGPPQTVTVPALFGNPWPPLPGDKQRYADNTTCQWIIPAPPAGYVTRFRIITKCLTDTDSLIIYDGASCIYQGGGCGNPYTHYHASQVLTVNFQSNAAGNSSGFIIYADVIQLACGGTFTYKDDSSQFIQQGVTTKALVGPHGAMPVLFTCPIYFNVDASIATPVTIQASYDFRPNFGTIMSVTEGFNTSTNIIWTSNSAIGVLAYPYPSIFSRNFTVVVVQTPSYVPVGSVLWDGSVFVAPQSIPYPQLYPPVTNVTGFATINLGIYQNNALYSWRAGIPGGTISFTTSLANLDQVTDFTTVRALNGTLLCSIKTPGTCTVPAPAVVTFQSGPNYRQQYSATLSTFGPTEVCSNYTSVLGSAGNFSHPKNFSTALLEPTQVNPCLWNITVSPGKKIALTIVYSLLPKDSLLVTDGNDAATAPTIILSPPVTDNVPVEHTYTLNASFGTTVLIQYRPQNDPFYPYYLRGSSFGFKVTWQAVDPVAGTVCSAVVRDADRVTPQNSMWASIPLNAYGTGNYSNNANCTFFFHGSYRSKLTFMNFHLGPGDSLRVYDTLNPASTLIATLTAGDTLPSPIYGIGATMALVFTSDGAGTSLGFEALMSSDKTSFMWPSCFNMNPTDLGYLNVGASGRGSVPCNAEPGAILNQAPINTRQITMIPPKNYGIMLVFEAFYAPTACSQQFLIVSPAPVGDLFEGYLTQGPLTLQIDSSCSTSGSYASFHWIAVPLTHPVPFCVSPNKLEARAIVTAPAIWNGINTYPANSSCVWTAATNIPTNVQFVVDQFAMGGNDSLTLASSSSFTPVVLAGLSPPSLPFTFSTIPYYDMHSLSLNGPTGGGTGFRVLISNVLGCPTNTLGSATPCDNTFQTPGVINYPCVYDVPFGITNYSYVSNPGCMNHLFLSNTNNYIELTVDYFFLAPGDYLSIFDGYDETSPVLAILNGTVTPGTTIYGSGQYLSYRLTTPVFRSVTAPGFVLRWRERIPGECSANTTLSCLKSGSTRYMRFPTTFGPTYPPCISCGWTVRSPIPAWRVRLDVLALSLRAGDQVVVYDGANNTAPALAIFNETYYKSLPVVFSSGDTLFITLKSSDQNDTFNGAFAFQYSTTNISLLCPGPTFKQDSKVWLIAASYAVSLPCPFNGAMYSGSVNYVPDTTYALQTPVGTGVQFYFDYFDTTPSNDVMSVYNSWTFTGGAVTLGPLNASFFGSRPAASNVTYSNPQNRMAVRFLISYGQGWRIRVNSTGVGMVGPVPFGVTATCQATPMVNDPVCPPLPSTANVTSTCASTPTKPGFTCSLMCAFGYTGTTLTWDCVSGGPGAPAAWFSTIYPICKLATCSPTAYWSYSPYHYSSTCAGTTIDVGTNCTRYCDAGYATFRGANTTMSCTVAQGATQGTLSPDPLSGDTCSTNYAQCPISYPSVPVSFANCPTNPIPYGAWCNFTCSAGYTGAPTSSKCIQAALGAFGTFDLPSNRIICTPTYCSPLPSNGTWVSTCVSSNTSYSTACFLTCMPGYVGYAYTQCQQAGVGGPGVFDSVRPTCRPTLCPPTPFGFNVTRSCAGVNTTVGGLCYLQCLPGQRDISNPSSALLRCDQLNYNLDAAWTNLNSTYPNCRLTQCAALGVNTTTPSTCDSVSTPYLGTCTRRCGNGFTGSSVTYLCQQTTVGATNTFNSTVPPVCTRATCAPLPSDAVVASACDAATTNYLGNCLQSCQPGYAGAAVNRTCAQPTPGGPGAFNGSQPTCTVTTCAALSDGANYISACASSTTAYGATCQLTCGAGLAGAITLPCGQPTMGAPAVFPNLVPDCSPASCDVFPVGPTAAASCSGTSLGATCNVTCQMGYTGAQVVRTCIQASAGANGTWDSSSGPPCVVATCPAISTTVSVNSTCDSTATGLAGTCTLACRAPYTGASVVRTCQQLVAGDAGVWDTNSQPACIGPPPPPPPPPMATPPPPPPHAQTSTSTVSTATATSPTTSSGPTGATSTSSSASTPASSSTTAAGASSATTTASSAATASPTTTSAQTGATSSSATATGDSTATAGGTAAAQIAAPGADNGGSGGGSGGAAAGAVIAVLIVLALVAAGVVYFLRKRKAQKTSPDLDSSSVQLAVVTPTEAGSVDAPSPAKEPAAAPQGDYAPAESAPVPAPVETAPPAVSAPDAAPAGTSAPLTAPAVEAPAVEAPTTAPSDATLTAV